MNNKFYVIFRKHTESKDEETENEYVLNKRPKYNFRKDVSEIKVSDLPGKGFKMHIKILTEFCRRMDEQKENFNKEKI